MIILCILFLILHIANAEKIILKEGSLERQTLSKDGFILFYEDMPPPEWTNIIKQSENIKDLYFFEMNCTKYDCSQNEFVNSYPTLVYSVDNSIWENIDIKSDLYTFTFETFEKSCFINRKKCKDHELETLNNFENESQETLQNTLDELNNRVAELESIFQNYIQQIQEDFNKKRLEIRKDLEITEDMIGILKDILSSINS